jgi:branched-chain amino acid transport system substrate-binding protein
MAKTVKFAALAAIAGLALAACGGSSEAKTLIIATDLPLQGSAKDANDSTNNAMALYLEQQDEDADTAGVQIGGYTIELKYYDNATAATGSWDDAACTKNATDHVANAAEVAVMGTYNSGCAKLIVPVLNEASDGPILMVSHANTNPGLTKAWDPGEPDIYYPSGKRSYARVVTTDDFQGSAAAQFAAQDLKVTKCYVLNDNQTYGQGVARAFAEEAAAQGIEVVGNEAWDAAQPTYTSLMQKIKATGADCVYLGGIFDNNGGALINDKVAVLGDNSKVKLMGPDGFTGYPDLTANPNAEGMYLTFAGLSSDLLLANGGKPADFLASYKAEYGVDPVGSYPLYGVAALQIILEAIKNSDGTRAGVNDAVFSTGVTVSAADSILGKEMTIDKTTGDVNVRDITVELVTGGAETTLKAWPVA